MTPAKIKRTSSVVNYRIHYSFGMSRRLMKKNKGNC